MEDAIQEFKNKYPAFKTLDDRHFNYHDGTVFIDAPGLKKITRKILNDEIPGNKEAAFFLLRKVSELDANKSNHNDVKR